MALTVFTDKQMRDYVEYVKVQRKARYNMYDPRARLATGLTKEDFLFVLGNYTLMAKQAETNAIGETA